MKQNTVDNSHTAISNWAVLPLRLFLGMIFLAAGIEKLTDPGFLNPEGATYIGKQLAGYVSADAPISGLLSGLVIPNAQLFGLVVALGEVAIGLGVMAGLLTRAAAFFGLLLSTSFWLTASWNAYPFYTGPDVPYMIGWLTLILTGAGVFSLDGLLASRRPLADAPDLGRRTTLARVGGGVAAGIALLVGGGIVAGSFIERGKSSASAGSQPSAMLPPAVPTNTPLPLATDTTAPPAATDTPLPLATDTTAPLVATDTPLPLATDTTAPAAATDTPLPLATDTTAPPAATAVPATIVGKVIAKVANIAPGGGLDFIIPGSNIPGKLVRLTDGSFLAYNGLCTHEGCEVNYQPKAANFRCPCHGALFSAADGSATLRPARVALTKINIRVDAATGLVYYVG